MIESVGDSTEELPASEAPSSLNFRIAGSWAAWGNVVLRDLVRRTNVLTVAGESPDVARNGDMVWASGHIFRSRLTDPARPELGRTTSQLTSAAGNFAPLTDGTNVVYSRLTNSTWVTVLSTAAGEEALAVGIGPSSPGVSPVYAINSGWVAYTKSGPTGIPQVWTRSPEGVHAQRTFFSDGGTLQSLNGDGQLTFSSGPDVYRSIPRVVQPLPVGRGSPLWISNQLHIVKGRSIFRERTGTLNVLPIGPNERRLTFQGAPGSRFVLQASTNLVNWTDVVSVTNQTGTFEYTDKAANRQRFYRVVQQ